VSDTETYEFDARTLSRAWLAVFSATSEDDERPLLYRTVAVELWESGVRLTATDSYMIWTAWVPKMGTKDAEPGMDELPDRVIVAHDADFRGRDLLKFAFKVVTAKDAPPQSVQLSLGPAPLEDGQFPGTESEAVSFTFPADAAIGERVVIATIDGTYPEWRSMLAGKVNKSLKTVCLSPHLLARIASIKRYWGNPLKFTFTGPTSVALMEPLPDLNPTAASLIGGVMPARENQEDQ
jgi:hypothetical protein